MRSASRFCRFTPWERAPPGYPQDKPDTHWIRGLTGPQDRCEVSWPYWNTLAVKLVASLYTDCAMPAHYTHTHTHTHTHIHCPWLESASELYRPGDRRMSTKLVPTFADRECHVVSVTDPYNRVLEFPGRSRYFFFQVAPQLYSRGWVDPVPDPLRLEIW
jgi:hypothetical protein